MQYWNLNSHTHFRDTYQQKTFSTLCWLYYYGAACAKNICWNIQIFFFVVMQFCAGCWKNSPHQRNVIWILWVLLDWCRTSAIRAVKSSKGQFDIYKMPGKLCMKQSAFYLHLCTVGGISIRSVRICSVSDWDSSIFSNTVVQVPIWKRSEPWLIWKGEISLLPKQFLGGWEKKKPQQLNKCKLYFVFH